MIAGEALLFDNLVNTDNAEECTYSEIKNNILKNFRDTKKEIIKNQIYSIYDITESFVKEALKNKSQTHIVNTILEQIASFKLNTSILLVGFDKGVAKISEINEAGSLDFRNINFHTIGSGSVQASNTLLFQKHSKKDNLCTTLYNVYKAKRNAEVMQGVGKETDIFILTEDKIIEISGENLELLAEIYDDEIMLGKTHKNLEKIKVE